MVGRRSFHFRFRPIFRAYLLLVSGRVRRMVQFQVDASSMFGWQLPRRLLVISRVYHSIDRGSSPSYPCTKAFIRVLTPIITAPLVLPVPFRPCVFGCKRCKCLTLGRRYPRRVVQVRVRTSGAFT